MSDKYRQYYPNVGYQTPRFFINSGVALFDFIKIKEGDLSITPGRRETLDFIRKSRDSPKAVLRCMDGDLSVVVPSASRRPPPSMCLVKDGSRAVQIATPAFQSTPVCHDSIPGHQVSNDFGKIVGYLTLSPQANALAANLLSLISTLIKVKRHLPSMSFYESHRRQPSITRFARLNKSGLET